MIITLGQLHANRVAGKVPVGEVVYSVCGPLTVPVPQVVVPDRIPLQGVDMRSNHRLDVIVAMDGQSFKRAFDLAECLLAVGPDQLDLWHIDTNRFVNVSTGSTKTMLACPPPAWAMELRQWRVVH